MPHWAEGNAWLGASPFSQRLRAAAAHGLGEAVPLEQAGMWVPLKLTPVEFRPGIRVGGLRVGNLFRGPAEGGELAPTPLADGPAQLGVFMLRSTQNCVAASRHTNS